ncbi:MAG: exonuclease SbcCD subunit D [Lachnospiraceae bacterium]
MKFIHCSDLHLGAEPEAGTPWAEARKNELWKTFGGILEVCNREETDLLLISGNLFHKQPLLYEVRQLNDMFATLKKTKVIFIAGNHDYISPRSKYRNFNWAENVTMLSGRDMQEIYLYGLDTTVYGFSYVENEITAPLYRDVKPKQSSGIHILLAHGGEAKHVPIDFDRLAESGFDYIALGHSTTPKCFGKNMYYSGSPEPLVSSDTGDHGFVKGEFNKTGTGYDLITEFVPFAQRIYLDIHVRVLAEDTNAAVSKYITEEMLKHGAGNMYRIYLEGIRGKEITFDKKAIAMKGMITEVIDSTVLDYNYAELRAANADNIIGAFINNINDLEEEASLKDSALYYGVDALLKASDRNR